MNSLTDVVSMVESLLVEGVDLNSPHAVSACDTGMVLLNEMYDAEMVTDEMLPTMELLMSSYGGTGRITRGWVEFFTDFMVPYQETYDELYGE